MNISTTFANPSWASDNEATIARAMRDTAFAERRAAAARYAFDDELTNRAAYADRSEWHSTQRGQAEAQMDAGFGYEYRCMDELVASTGAERTTLHKRLRRMVAAGTAEKSRERRSAAHPNQLVVVYRRVKSWAV